MKKDLRIIKTENSLRISLTKLLKEKTFEEIKVSDICVEALVNRSTFYAHYNDKYELLMDLIKELKNSILSKVDSKNYKNDLKGYYLNLINALLDYIELENDIYKPIIINNRNSIVMDILLDEISKDVIEKFNNSNVKYKIPVDILTKFYLGALVSVCVSFLENPNKYSKKELVDYLSQLIPSFNR